MKIASFNIQKFGKNTTSELDVVQILVQIVSQYDIIVILGVVDASGTSVETFLEAVNKHNKKHHYTLKVCTRLGRTRCKEQFMFLYRDDLVDLVGSYQSDDEATDVLSREPYILRFRCLNTGLKDLVVIPVHIKPEDSEKELDELYDVFLNVKKRWKTDNVMILGDFNADGSYVCNKNMKTIRIRSDRNFHWLVGEDDSTENNMNDRVVVYGDDMLQAVVTNSVKTFNFQKAYGLTEEQALKVSDRHPVEVELKSVDAGNGSEGPTGELAVVDEDLLELKRGNLLLERQKLNLEIQILQRKLAKMSNGDAV